MRRVVRGVAVAALVCVAACGWCDLTGTSNKGAVVTFSPLGKGNDAPLDRKDVQALEKAYGDDLTLAVVDVNNIHGTDDFRFYTSCCYDVVGSTGAERLPWVNLREVAKRADLRPSASENFADQDILKGTTGRFVVGWNHKALTTLGHLTIVAIFLFEELCVVECR